MTKRLALFEFTKHVPTEDFRIYVSNLAKDIKSLIEAIDPSRIDKSVDIYAKEGARANLRRKADEGILKLASLLKAPTDLQAIQDEVKYLEDILQILSAFRAEVTSELGMATIANIKNIVARAKQVLPNKDKLFNRATNIDRRTGTEFDQVIPSDPNAVMPSAPTPEEAVLARASHLRRLGI